MSEIIYILLYGRQSVFTHLNFNSKGSHNVALLHSTQAGILGLVPERSAPCSNLGPLQRVCPKCLNLTHDSFCTGPIRCRKCLGFGHNSGTSIITSRFTCLSSPVSAPSLPPRSLKSGPPVYHSFAYYFYKISSVPPSPSTVIPWSRTWHLATPEFDDDDPSPESQSPLVTVDGLTLSSFGEFANRALGISHVPPVLHIAWSLKTQLLLQCHTKNRRWPIVLLIQVRFYRFMRNGLWCLVAL